MSMLKIVTVYDSPADFPGLFVARQFNIFGSRIIPGEVLIKDKSLDVVRNELEQSFGLTKICRQENDEPQIVESWL